MAIATFDFAQLLKDIPAGAWVAISERQGKVITYGADMQQVLAEAREKGEKEPLIIKVPDRQEILFL